MRHVWLTGLALALLIGRAEAAYVGSPPLVVGVVNSGAQPIGVMNQGQPTIPLLTTVVPSFAPPIPSIPIRPAFAPPEIVTDGVRPISIAPPYVGAGTGQPALVVGLSPNPNYQCPQTQAINQTANATVITNPGGKRLYVCNVGVINGATAQSVTISEGTGTTCGTGTTYWLGGAGGTAALAVNGGFSFMGINWAMQTPGDNVCVLVSGSTNVSGTMTYGVY